MSYDIPRTMARTREEQNEETLQLFELVDQLEDSYDADNYIWHVDVIFQILAIAGLYMETYWDLCQFKNRLMVAVSNSEKRRVMISIPLADIERKIKELGGTAI